MDEPEFRREYYDAPSGRVAFRDVGAGLPVLYFHGTGAGSDAALLLERDLIEAGCRLIVPDRPGYARTSLGPCGSVKFCVALVAELLDHLHIERAAVIGTSGGGMTAAAFTSLHPRRTAALVLQGAQAHRWDDRSWLPRGIQIALFLFRHPVFYPFLRWYHFRHSQAIVRRPESYLRSMSGSRFAALRKDVAVMSVITRLTKMVAACARQPEGTENDWTIMVGDNGIRAGMISCPTLIIHDREDPIVPFAHAEWSKAAIPVAELLDVNVGGHLIWFGRDAKRMQQRRLEFLREHVAN